MMTSFLREAESRYRTLVESAKRKDIPVEELIEEERIKHILPLSDFIFRVITKEPEILLDLIESSDLFRDYSEGEYKERIRKGLENKENRRMLEKEIRKIRKREMVRIAWRDIEGRADTVKTMKELSLFADACIDAAVEIFYSIYSKRYGTPIGESSHLPQQLIVIGLGKLGGNELNFSSDIDIMFAYPEQGKTYSDITNDEFFSRVSLDIVKFLSEYTEDGFVFRVDTRLRPFGKSGSMVMNFDALEEYYQTYGREWERYALIKARIVGGDIERGEELLNRLKPFVYRRYLDYTVFDSIRDMKHKIMEEERWISILDNIKIGPGGIREIEFFVQVFQLLRGGIDPDLQVQNLLNALDVLEKKEYVPSDICKRFKDAYLFLRKLENRLQEYDDLQTHTIPKDEGRRLKIAISMGCRNWDEFYEYLLYHTSFVHNQFKDLLKSKHKGTEKFYLVWEIDDSERRKELLNSLGFLKAEKIDSIISDLRDLPKIRHMGTRGRSLLKEVISAILERLLKEKEAAEILKRLSSLIKNISLRTNYLSLMLENPSVIDHLIRLAKESSWIISFVARYPVLLDELIDPRTLYTPPTREELEKEMKYRLENLDLDDKEVQMIQLALLRYTNMLRVAASDITGVISVMDVSTYLTDIAEVVLNASMILAWRNIQKKIKSAPGPEGRGFCIIGYGKLGGRELSYSSDLDLVFLYSPDSSDSTFYIKVSQEIIRLLTTYTIMGRAYEVDTRLRPDGSSGVLAVNIDSYREYQINRAWTWEHQALLRARPICGDEPLKAQFEKVRYEVLTKKREKEKLFNEVWEMRQKIMSQLSKNRPGLFHIKNDPGGIIDIEFLIQYLVLLYASSFPQLIKWRAHIYFLEELKKVEVIKEEDAKFLKDTYIKMRYTIHKLSLQEKMPIVEEDQFKEVRKKVIDMWDKVK